MKPFNNKSWLRYPRITRGFNWQKFTSHTARINRRSSTTFLPQPLQKRIFYHINYPLLTGSLEHRLCTISCAGISMSRAWLRTNILHWVILTVYQGKSPYVKGTVGFIYFMLLEHWRRLQWIFWANSENHRNITKSFPSPTGIEYWQESSPEQGSTPKKVARIYMHDWTVMYRNPS